MITYHHKYKEQLIALVALLIFASSLLLIIIGCSYNAMIPLTIQNDSLINQEKEKVNLLISYRDIIKSIYENENIVFKCTGQIKYNNQPIPYDKLRHKLLIRISTDNCWSCVRSLSQMINRYRQKNIIYLMNATSKEAMNALIAYADLRGEIYICPTILNTPIEEYNEPYLFRIDEFGRMTNVFTPIKDEQQSMNVYINYFKTYKL
jgi:hypothetical protein